MKKCWQALKKLKKFLASPPLLVEPEVRNELYLYLTTSSEVINFVLVRVDDKGAQKSIYYTRKVLCDAETRYSKPEKVVFALIIFA